MALHLQEKPATSIRFGDVFSGRAEVSAIAEPVRSEERGRNGARFGAAAG